jgi:histidyl-tRNA synthetase
VSRPRLQAPRGTRDFYPEELRARSWLFAHFREVSRRFGYEEVDAPIVEHEELFTRKAGEEIVEQGALRFPVRWFMIGQNWRYERMTRGRRREHYQWNVELLGEAGVGAEAELIAAIFTLLDRLGLDPEDVRMRLSSRALLEELLCEGVLRARPEAFAPLCVVIDKLDKIGGEAVVEQLCDPKGLVGIERSEAEEVVATLAVRSLEEMEARLGAGSAALADLRRLFELLDAYGVADRAAFDASVVRGLAYYTGIVFEAFDAGGILRALCGGGRYDRLLQTLGGPALPAVGFGFGDETIMELLAEKNRKPTLGRGLQDVVFAVTEAERTTAVRVATALRAEGRSVELVLGSGRAKRALADAGKAGAERVVLIGPEELARGVMKIRDLRAREDAELPLPTAPSR